MTVFVYEDVTATWAGGSGMPGPPAASLLAEGRAMRDAVTTDLAAVPGVQVITGYQADWTLLIAPECGGRLEHLAREALRVGGRLLGPSPDAIHLTADKLELARHWARHGVPTPATWPLGAEPMGMPLVIKPRDGAGSQEMSLLPTPTRHCGGAGKDMIAQEYIPGFAASVAFLIGPRTRTPLVPCQQLLSDDGRFEYRGGRLPIAPDLAARALRIATAAVECVPGLLGYAGVDVVLGDDGHDRAIEINPRLTTSYVGLRALARFNLAGAMLAAVCGEPMPRIEWDIGPVEFTPDGRVDRPAPPTRAAAART